MTLSNILGGLIFGAIGFVAFVYGKKMGRPITLVLGVLLMGFPYFIPNTLWMYAVGIGLTAALYYFRD